MEWSIYFVSPLHFQLRRPDGTFALGVCNYNLKSIYINRELNESLLKKVLTHEVAHAAAFSYNNNLTYDEYEMLAEFGATYGSRIITNTNYIFKTYKQKKGTWK